MKVTYKLFGFIPLWSVERDVNEDALYERMGERFRKALNDEVKQQRSGK